MLRKLEKCKTYFTKGIFKRISSGKNLIFRIHYLATSRSLTYANLYRLHTCEVIIQTRDCRRFTGITYFIFNIFNVKLTLSDCSDYVYYITDK